MPRHEDQKVQFTAGALDVIENCTQRISDVRYWHGPAEAGRMALSFAECLGRLVLNSDRIMWDGDLSLVAHYRIDMVVGMNFSPDSLDSVFERAGHNPAMVRASLGDTIHQMPVSGTWSLNS